MNSLNDQQVREAVRENYAKKAAIPSTDCGCNPSSCCGGEEEQSVMERSAAMGYSPEELNWLPEGANLGLGCGNPQALADLKPGESVLDLGSGGGIDCFFAARAVGEKGRVIGVDMTPEMISKARGNLLKTGLRNVEFRLGEIEHLPVADRCIDVIISNCVINLAPDKLPVFQEAFRVLKPGGRLAVSDIVARSELPAAIREDLALHTGCVAGAATIESLTGMLQASGFSDIRIIPREESRKMVQEWEPRKSIEDYVVSANIQAVKPPAAGAE